MAQIRKCLRCGGSADMVNGDQAFCDSCWGDIWGTWSLCTECGQIFETFRAHNGHMNRHRRPPRAGNPGELRRLVPISFVRLPGR